MVANYLIQKNIFNHNLVPRFEPVPETIFDSAIFERRKTFICIVIQVFPPGFEFETHQDSNLFSTPNTDNFYTVAR